MASNASAMPGATTARLVVWLSEMPMKLFMMPQTVPNSPTKGAVAPIVASTPVPTAPFVGLFGTVWGIMNSFIGISESQTTNLAVVAPGIAEALLATALGLVAAIPAVVIYHVFARSTAGYRALLADAAAGVERLVSRDLDRRRLDAARRQEAA